MWRLLSRSKNLIDDRSTVAARVWYGECNETETLSTAHCYLRNANLDSLDFAFCFKENTSSSFRAISQNRHRNENRNEFFCLSDSMNVGLILNQLRTQNSLLLWQWNEIERMNSTEFVHNIRIAVLMLINMMCDEFAQHRDSPSSDAVYHYFFFFFNSLLYVDVLINCFVKEYSWNDVYAPPLKHIGDGEIMPNID